MIRSGCDVEVQKRNKRSSLRKKRGVKTLTDYKPFLTIQMNMAYSYNLIQIAHSTARSVC